MRLKEQDPVETQAQIKRIFEGVQAQTRSRRGYTDGDLYRENKKAFERLDSERLIELDDARQRDFNRALLLSINIEEGNFVFDEDPNIEGVAYLTDRSVANEFSHQAFFREKQIQSHNRILLLDGENHIGAIEFFNVSEGIDLSELLDIDEPAKILSEKGFSIILNPQKPQEV